MTLDKVIFMLIKGWTVVGEDRFAPCLFTIKTQQAFNWLIIWICDQHLSGYLIHGKSVLHIILSLKKCFIAKLGYMPKKNNLISILQDNN